MVHLVEWAEGDLWILGHSSSPEMTVPRDFAAMAGPLEGCAAARAVSPRRPWASVESGNVTLTTRHVCPAELAERLAGGSAPHSKMPGG